MQRYFLSILLSVFALHALKSEAVNVNLTKTYMYRNVRYMNFKTEETPLSALVAIKQLLEAEDEAGAEQIEQAIANEDFQHASNVVYFYPPLILNDQHYYQLYIYGKAKIFSEFLREILSAARASLPNLTAEQREKYKEAMRRIAIRLKALDEASKEQARGEAEEEKNSKKRESVDRVKKYTQKKRQRAKVAGPQEVPPVVATEAEFEPPPVLLPDVFIDLPPPEEILEQLALLNERLHPALHFW